MRTTDGCCVAFDLDDTLYKERDFVESGRKAVAAAMSDISGIDARRLYDVMAKADNAFDALLGELSGHVAEPVTIDSILEIYRCHMPDLNLPADTAGLLAGLKSRGVDMGLITDGRSVTQWNKIKALGLEKYIDRHNIIVSEDVGSDKHKPLPFEILEARVGARSYIYVGDNPAKDFHYPNIKGWQTVMLRDAKGENVHSQSFKGLSVEFIPQVIIDNINEINKFI